LTESRRAGCHKIRPHGGADAVIHHKAVLVEPFEEINVQTGIQAGTVKLPGPKMWSTLLPDDERMPDGIR